jgi:hypothetical protein
LGRPQRCLWLTSDCERNREQHGRWARRFHHVKVAANFKVKTDEFVHDLA